MPLRISIGWRHELKPFIGIPGPFRLRKKSVHSTSSKQTNQNKTTPQQQQQQQPTLISNLFRKPWKARAKKKNLSLKISILLSLHVRTDLHKALSNHLAVHGGAPSRSFWKWSHGAPTIVINGAVTTPISCSLEVISPQRSYFTIIAARESSLQSSKKPIQKTWVTISSTTVPRIDIHFLSF